MRFNRGFESVISGQRQVLGPIGLIVRPVADEIEFIGDIEIALSVSDRVGAQMFAVEGAQLRQCLDRG